MEYLPGYNPSHSQAPLPVSLSPFSPPGATLPSSEAHGSVSGHDPYPALTRAQRFWVTHLLVSVMAGPSRSHSNSYTFYEAANSYEFIRPHSYEFVRYLLNCTYFTSCPIQIYSYEWPTPDSAPKPTHHVGLDKSYKFVRVRSYEFVRISHLFIIRMNSYELVVR